MPARSVKQRKAMAIAEHHPEELYGRNKSLLGMSHEQLHEFADTPEKNLPERSSGAVSRAARKSRKRR